MRGSEARAVDETEGVMGPPKEARAETLASIAAAELEAARLGGRAWSRFVADAEAQVGLPWWHIRQCLNDLSYAEGLSPRATEKELRRVEGELARVNAEKRLLDELRHRLVASAGETP